MWIEYIKSISDDFEFSKAATEKALSKAESTLGLTLPAELRELLKETNGVEQRSTYLLFILPVERIEACFPPQHQLLSKRRKANWGFAYLPFSESSTIRWPMGASALYTEFLDLKEDTSTMTSSMTSMVVH
jgi:hypothetical protein